MCRKKKKKNADETIFSVNFTYQDLTAMEEFLEAKQQEGLQLVDYTSSRMKFKKCEPSESRYSCEIFLDRNRPDFDKDFVEMCESGGWKYICTDNAGLYIFKTDDENVPDIMTDDKMKLSMVIKSVLSSQFWRSLALILWIIDDILEEVLRTDLSRLNTSSITAFPIYIVFIIDIVSIIIWIIKRKVEIKNGQKLTLNNLQQYEKKRATRIIIHSIGVSIMAWLSILFDMKIVGLIAFGVCIIMLLCLFWENRKNIEISKADNQKCKRILAALIAATIGTAILSYVVLPPVEDETALAKQIISELSLEVEDVTDYKNRINQLYDGGYAFEMLKCKIPFIRNRKAKKLIDEYQNYEDVTIRKQTDENFEYYEFGDENYIVVAVVGDYVVHIHYPKGNTEQVLKNVLLDSKQKG